MNNFPQVSVVCSAFNAGDTLINSLESVLSQEGVDFEVVVVNDGSTDDTLRLLRRFAAKDDRIRVLDQENRGLTRALISGCEVANGRYIARLDADDLCLPGRLKKQCQLLDKNSDVVFVSCWSQAIGPQNETLFETQRPADSSKATHALLFERQGPTAHGSVMFRKSTYEMVGGYRPEFYFAQDSDLWLRLGEVGKLAYVPEVLYSFRISPTGVSSKFREVQHALGELAHACRNARLNGDQELPFLAQAKTMRPGLAKPVKSDPVAGNYFIGRCLSRRGDLRAARYLAKVLVRRPWQIGAWFGLIECLGPRGSQTEAK